MYVFVKGEGAWIYIFFHISNWNCRLFSNKMHCIERGFFSLTVERLLFHYLVTFVFLSVFEFVCDTINSAIHSSINQWIYWNGHFQPSFKTKKVFKWTICCDILLFPVYFKMFLIKLKLDFICLGDILNSIHKFITEIDDDTFQ